MKTIKNFLLLALLCAGGLTLTSEQQLTPQQMAALLALQAQLQTPAAAMPMMPMQLPPMYSMPQQAPLYPGFGIPALGAGAAPIMQILQLQRTILNQQQAAFFATIQQMQQQAAPALLAQMPVAAAEQQAAPQPHDESADAVVIGSVEHSFQPAYLQADAASPAQQHVMPRAAGSPAVDNEQAEATDGESDDQKPAAAAREKKSTAKLLVLDGKSQNCGFPGCTKTFADRSNLNRHRKTHNAPDPKLFCCGHQYKRRDALQKHREKAQCQSKAVSETHKKRKDGPGDDKQGPAKRARTQAGAGNQS